MLLRLIITIILLGINNLYAHNIAITQIVSHPSLDAVREGIVDELKSFNPKINIHYSTANGSISTAAQIASNLVGKNLDIVIGISTPSAQSLHQKIKNIPVIFSTVTDPKIAGLVNNYFEPEGNVTGVMNNMSVEKYFNFIKYLLPKAKNIGILYNSSEINSVLTIQAMKQNREFTIIEKAINNSSESSLALKSIIDKIDCLFMIQDNMVATNSNLLINYAIKNNKPVIASFPEAIRMGALAAIAYDEYKIGRQTGQMVIKILKGQKISATSVENAKIEEKILNIKVADQLNISLGKNYQTYFTEIK